MQEASLHRNDTPVIPEDRPAITGIPQNGMKKSSSINSMA